MKTMELFSFDQEKSIHLKPIERAQTPEAEC